MSLRHRARKPIGHLSDLTSEQPLVDFLVCGRHAGILPGRSLALFLLHFLYTLCRLVRSLS